MDAILRSRRLLLSAFTVVALACAGVAVAACAARGPGTPVGVSTAGHGAGGGDSDGGTDGGRRVSGLPADFKMRVGYTKVNAARIVSNGHAAGRWDVDIYVSSSAKDAYASSSVDVPVGARLLKEHFVRGLPAGASASGASGASSASSASDGAERGSTSGPIMMMEKMEKGFDPDHGDWRYVVVNSAGVTVEDGRVESCAGCHDDAPHDHIFRVVP